MYTIRNAHTGTIYAKVPTMQKARAYCGQHLLTAATDNRTRYLSALAAGFVDVYDNSGSDHYRDGF
jgi:hypothetical protein